MKVGDVPIRCKACGYGGPAKRCAVKGNDTTDLLEFYCPECGDGSPDSVYVDGLVTARYAE